jgi:hypothetical protein
LPCFDTRQNIHGIDRHGKDICLVYFWRWHGKGVCRVQCLHTRQWKVTWRFGEVSRHSYVCHVASKTHGNNLNMPCSFSSYTATHCHVYEKFAVYFLSGHTATKWHCAVLYLSRHTAKY